MFKYDYAKAICVKYNYFATEVINFPFPESNIHTFHGQKVFYSQLVRCTRLCNYIPDFQTRVGPKVIWNSYVLDQLLCRSCIKLCIKCNISVIYGINDYQSSCLQILDFDSYISCNINNPENVDIVKPCKMLYSMISTTKKSKS